MRDWLGNLVGPQYVDAILWTAAALVLLVALLALIKFVTRLNSGTFVAGGRNRRTRLAVMDATAVDSQRRLVLVRRDDVEHLLLIGGPSDVVVETDIRMMAQRRPATPPANPDAPRQQVGEEPDMLSVPPARPQPRPTPLPPSRSADPGPARPPLPPGERTTRPPPPPTELRRATDIPRPQPVRPLPPEPRMVPPRPVSAARPSPTLAPRTENTTRVDSIDETLMNELDLSSDLGPSAANGAKQPAPQPSLDDEMARLLGELSSPKR